MIEQRLTLVGPLSRIVEINLLFQFLNRFEHILWEMYFRFPSFDFSFPSQPLLDRKNIRRSIQDIHQKIGIVFLVHIQRFFKVFECLFDALGWQGNEKWPTRIFYYRFGSGFGTVTKETTILIEYANHRPNQRQKIIRQSNKSNQIRSSRLTTESTKLVELLPMLPGNCSCLS